MSLLANAYGNFLSSALPYYQSLPGIITPYGTLLKPGGRIAAYVRSTGAQDGEDHFAASGMLVSTLNAGLARCRSGQGDIVYVLPGHTESISTADFMSSLVAGTQIVSAGCPGMTNNPTLTWTAAAGTFLLDVADVSIVGMTLDWAGVADCAAPMTVTGAGCAMIGNHIVAQSDVVSFQCLKGVTVSTGAHNFLFANNYVRADSEDDDANVTGGIINIAAVVRGVKVVNNIIAYACAGDTVGIVDQTAAATNTVVANNLFRQLAANAAFAIIMDDGHGYVHNNYIRITENVAPTSAGVSIASGTFLLHDNQVSAANAATTATHAADS
jgi:hypothetical protein